LKIAKIVGQKSIECVSVKGIAVGIDCFDSLFRGAILRGCAGCGEMANAPDAGPHRDFCGVAALLSLAPGPGFKRTLYINDITLFCAFRKAPCNDLRVNGNVVPFSLFLPVAV